MREALPGLLGGKRALIPCAEPSRAHTPPPAHPAAQAGVLYVMTHDSIGLGEDGPTHQPIEHLASFRAMPNMLTMRPGDGNETAGAYQVGVRA